MRLATRATPRLPARPVMDGDSPEARELELAVELDAVDVPLVWLIFDVTRAVRLVSDPKALVTALEFLQTEVE